MEDRESRAARIPVLEEELHVGSRTTETGKGVRVIKRVRKEEETLDLPLFTEQYEVERIARDEWVEEGEMPRMREEADGTLVLPVLEEVLVVRVKLREEIRLTRKRQESRATQTVVLRREEVEIQPIERKPD